MGERVIVSGGQGFLGSHLVDRLVERGDRVMVIDNLWTGTDRFVNENGALYLEMDVSDTEHMSYYKYSSLKRESFDRIYHLASPASPDKYMARPVDTMRANFLGALNLLPLLRPGGRFCFTSTSEVYGDPLVSPLPETYRGSVDCTGPRSSYDESKRATEALLHEVHRTQGVDVRCARIFNAYGPRTLLDDGRAVSNFIAAGLQGREIEVYGDGQQTRCFTYVDCVVEGLMRYWDLEPRYSGAADEANPFARMGQTESVPLEMNIGLDRETTVLEIAEHVSRLFGVPIRHAPAAVHDPRQRRPDLTRARDWMPDWDPARVSYEEGIERTVAHFREEYGL